jgi:iron(III) transport system substrate-binding protein
MIEAIGRIGKNRRNRGGIRPLLLILLGFSVPLPTATFAQTPGIADVAGTQGADRLQKLAAGARKEGTLSIYTSATTEDMNVLGAAFQKQYGVKLQVWRASGETITQRAVTEARGGRFDADVFETDGPVMETLHRENILQTFDSPVLNDLIPAATPSHREWIGDRVQIFTAAYNTDSVKKADVPKVYADLTNPKWKGKLGIENDDSDWFSVVVGTLGEEPGLALFRDIVKTNGLSVRKGHTLIANLVVSGEVPFALTTYLYKIQQLKNQGAPVDWVALAPEVARAQGVGMARRAPHPYAAALFMDFLLTDGQAILGQRDFIPTNIKVKPLPSELDLKFTDPAKILDDGGKWDKLYREIIGNRRR